MRAWLRRLRWGIWHPAEFIAAFTVTALMMWALEDHLQRWERDQSRDGR